MCDLGTYVPWLYIKQTNQKLFKSIFSPNLMKLGRKITGGRYIANKKKKKHTLVRPSRNTKIGSTKRKTIRTRGANKKQALLTCDTANILDQNKKAKQAKILNVTETQSNRFWARQNRLVKGSIIETDLGKAKITNRPGQEGCVNAVLIKEK